ncbi:hypothetical protein A628_04779 [Salmonella enterica subsp. enterica serovar Cubana str. 76814]|nr:hypothetical protein A628_04779 [Salmonella enterica subsp. enterica serovar Cubana str. 76814]
MLSVYQPNRHDLNPKEWAQRNQPQKVSISRKSGNGCANAASVTACVRKVKNNL